MDNYYLDYFYGLEADAYSFIRVPKLLINLPIYMHTALSVCQSC